MEALWAPLDPCGPIWAPQGPIWVPWGPPLDSFWTPIEKAQLPRTPPKIAKDLPRTPKYPGARPGTRSVGDPAAPRGRNVSTQVWELAPIPSLRGTQNQVFRKYTFLRWNSRARTRNVYFYTWYDLLLQVGFMVNRTPETSKYQRFLWEIQHFDTHIHICEKKGCRVPSGNNKIEVSKAWARPARFNLWEKARPEGHTKSYKKKLEIHTFRGGGPQLRPVRFPCTPRGNPANNENLRFLLYV